MKKKTVVHFGGGALGRGLVIPLLVDSGYDVVLVDTNTALIEALGRHCSYPLDLTDAQPDSRLRTIPLKAVINGQDTEKVAEWLHKTDIVTTSVLRNNLVHIARTISGIWGTDDCTGKMVLCCENVENVGAYFRSLLLDNAEPEAYGNLEQLRVPDVVVDRICTAHFPDTIQVSSELFYECAVDAEVLADTGIELIKSIANITGAFYKKRFLMNTYADAVSFLALPKGKSYLYEATVDEAINRDVAAYIALLKRLLIVEYGYSPEEVDQWADCYRSRLSNCEIPRSLETVARNFWQKITLEERFIAPVIQLMRLKENTDAAIPFLVKLIQAGVLSADAEIKTDEVGRRLQSLWENDPDGTVLWQAVMKEFKTE